MNHSKHQALLLDEARFHAIYRELIDENPFAARAALKVLHIEFSDTVPTLAVSLEARPRLLVNLAFLREHCLAEDEVKAVICHEFLHILLRHTERFRALDPVQNLALDAVINAIIHREFGTRYSGFMSRFYAAERGLGRLLRPPAAGRYYVLWNEKVDPVKSAWRGLYDGRLVADDILDLARELAGIRRLHRQPLLGGHQGRESGKAGGQAPEAGQGGEPRPLPSVLSEALDQGLKAMNGEGIWRSPKGRGVGATAYQAVVSAADARLGRWRQEAYTVLRRHLSPDPRSANREPRPYEFALPVLSTADRRAALRTLWSPFLPEALWRGEQARPGGTAQVYLDVSGSMNAEMPLLVQLLGQLGRYIRRPFWAFSDEVAPAVIENGRLKTGTTGGTTMACVLRHIARTRPSAAVVITDGYIEQLPPALVRGIGNTRLHAIVSRDGSPDRLRAAGIPYTQLARIPT